MTISLNTEWQKGVTTYSFKDKKIGTAELADEGIYRIDLEEPLDNDTYRTLIDHEFSSLEAVNWAMLFIAQDMYDLGCFN